MNAKKIIIDILQPIDIQIDGNNPWDIKVHNEKLYQRLLTDGALGLGESYMDQWWDCERIDILIYKLLQARLDTKARYSFAFKLRLMLAKIINFQTKKRARLVAKKHYDLGNDLFKAMLDKRMIYSCAYWKDVPTLEAAQAAKLELICKKLHLKPGLRLLDIGCGWGGLAKYAAENYGVNVVGITISKQQCEYAQSYCQNLPVEIRLQDYRDVTEKYDRIVSVGMFEHVGHLNYLDYMKCVHQSLEDNGLFLLHTIGGNVTSLHANPWITKYIFPNGMIPAIPQISRSAENLLIMEDWHNFGAYYDNTLLAWYDNFVKHWQTVQENYDERFFRMWSFYLLSCAGGFRARYLQLWQIVFSKQGIPGGYLAPR